MDSEAGTSNNGHRRLYSSGDGLYSGDFESLTEDCTTLGEESDRRTCTLYETSNASVGSDGGPFQYDNINFRSLSEIHLLGKEFKTVEDADKFYTSYGKFMGFGVRKDKIAHSKNGKVSMRRWVCSKEGQRDAKWINAQKSSESSARRPRSITRENCKASFRVTYKPKKDAYTVTEFRIAHSHPLVTSREVTYHRSHRNVSTGELAQAEALRKVSVRTCITYDYLVSQAGGYVNVGFTAKDLYNRMDEQRRTILGESDAEAAIAYMSAKSATDPGFFCKFSVDEENRLANLFWRDSTSLSDYSCFGDILVFDSTYKTNRYGKPMVFFVGVNNHRGNVLFASALLVNETAATYAWLLRTFLESMKDKKPISVMTDGDEAMRNAIDEVLPESRHRLCSWHVGNNANLNLRNTELIIEFKRCMYRKISPDQFELAWRNMVDVVAVKLENEEREKNQGEDGEECSEEGRSVKWEKRYEWLRMMYLKKHKWAAAFLRGHFFGGLQSTQRCESINRCMKDFLTKTNMKVFECIPLLDRAVLRLRNNAAITDFKDKYSSPVLTTHLRSLEEHASSVFTANAFELVHREISGVAALIASPTVAVTGSMVYPISIYGEEGSNWTVVRQIGPGIRMECSCKLFESDGIPCSHLFCVMKNEQIRQIPECLLNKRWTKGARSSVDVGGAELDSPTDNVGLQAVRYGALSGSFNSMCYFGSLTTEGYMLLKQELAGLSARVQNIWKQHEATTLGLRSQQNFVRDPKVAKRKEKRTAASTSEAAPAKRRDVRCGLCKEYGHNRRNCHSVGGPKYRAGEGGVNSEFHSNRSAIHAYGGHRENKQISPSPTTFHAASSRNSNEPWPSVDERSSQYTIDSGLFNCNTFLFSNEGSTEHQFLGSYDSQSQ